jgi:hypothetical protein
MVTRLALPAHVPALPTWSTQRRPNSLIFTHVPLPGCGSGLFDGVRVKIEMDRRA